MHLSLSMLFIYQKYLGYYPPSQVSRQPLFNEQCIWAEMLFHFNDFWPVSSEPGFSELRGYLGKANLVPVFERPTLHLCYSNCFLHLWAICGIMRIGNFEYIYWLNPETTSVINDHALIKVQSHGPHINVSDGIVFDCDQKGSYTGKVSVCSLLKQQFNHRWLMHY